MTALRRCPRCRNVCDTQSSLEGNVEPRAGDVSVCLYCHAVNQFGEGLELLPFAEKTLSERQQRQIRRLRFLMRTYGTPASSNESSQVSQ